MDPFQTKRILILGTTYPSYSTKYMENACTGGLEEGSLRMVRIHPIPKRYLDEDQRFKKFQWITVRARHHDSDGRPESLRVEPDSITIGDVIPAKDHEERRRLIEKSPHFFRSVEELHERWDSDRTSLGTIRPKEILGVKVTKKNDTERKEWKEKEDKLFAQGVLPIDKPPKRIDFPDLNFLVKWVCDDPRCAKPHEMKMLQWGLHELARKYDGDPDRINKVEAAMTKELDLDQRDVFLFMGNFRGKLFNFGLMDSFSPLKHSQLGFDFG